MVLCLCWWEGWEGGGGGQSLSPFIRVSGGESDRKGVVDCWVGRHGVTSRGVGGVARDWRGQTLQDWPVLCVENGFR